MMGPAAAEMVQLYAAGSLREALTDAAMAYQAASGNIVRPGSARPVR
jgi:ABC-type molybdate transport system substrate-binding protein